MGDLAILAKMSNSKKGFKRFRSNFLPSRSIANSPTNLLGFRLTFD